MAASTTSGHGTAGCTQRFGQPACTCEKAFSLGCHLALLEMLNAIGGAAQYYARTVEQVLGVHLMEFGIPEAMWHLRVKGFAAIVTMDAHGNSLHADVEKATGEALAALQEA